MTETIQQVNEEFVRYVLDTYDLPERTRDRLVRHSLFRLKDNEVNDFNEAYTYLNRLATEAELRHHAKMLSLDERVGKTERTRHERIGADDTNLVSLLESGETEETLSGQEVIEYLSQTMDHQEIEVLTTLLGDQKIELEASPNYLLENAEQIGARVRDLAQRYEKEGILLIPRKQVVQVEWDPFRVKFHVRRGRPLTEEEKEIIRNAYNLFGGNAKRAAEHLEYAPASVRKTWRSAGFKINPSGPLYNPNDPRHIKVIETYKKNGGDMTKTAEDLGRSMNYVWNHVKKEGLSSRKSGSRKKEQPREIIKVKTLHNIEEAVRRIESKNVDRLQQVTGHPKRILEKYLPYI
ncbi:MAG: hypothetical protein Q8P81_00390 [Nanoarchaeota archaeon]|nr:hypothetical protein [Nanoarchaeota archaeon]